MSITEQAHNFAKAKHKGQKYDNKPYTSHPALVFKVIRFLCPLDYNLQAAAWLHDVLENTQTTPAELTEAFGADVAGLVYEVTKTGYNIFPHLKTRRGVILKFADRLCNLIHMVNWPKEKQEAYIEKSTFWKI